MRSSVFMHMKTPSVTIQGNITAMKYRNDVIQLVLLTNISDNLGMMLARNYESCHAGKRTLVMLEANNMQLRWPAKSLDLNPINHLLDLFETQGSCTVAATKSQGTQPCYSSDVCGHSTTVYL